MLRALAPLVLLLLSACATATAPAYRAAQDGGPGYSEIALGEGRWRVEYQGARGQGLDEVEAALLLRAAELAQTAGYDRFAVIRRGVEDRAAILDNRPRWGVGLGVGSGGWSGARVGVGVPLIVARDRQTAFAEIRALPAGAVTGAETYSAEALVAALTPRLRGAP